MQSFNALILGASQTGTRIANQLGQQKLKTALISFPNRNEDYLLQLVAALSPEQRTLEPIVPEEHIVKIRAQSSPQFLDERRMSIDGEEIRFKHAILATGCGPRVVSGVENTVTPVEFFQASAFRSNTTVWGAGPAGVCTAMKIASYGKQARLISKHPRVLPNEDETLADFVTKELQKKGIQIMRAEEPVSSTDSNVMCIGLKPHSDDLNLRAAFIYVDPVSGRVKTDSLMRTSNPHVSAAGAVTGPPFHLGFERFQADLVAENIPASVFMKRRFMPEPFPALIPFSTPLARVGLTEAEANKKFKDALAIVSPTENGFVKLIALKRSGLLAGAHVAGAGADGLILFFDLLMRTEIPIRDVSDRHHFPSAALSDAAADAMERWIALAGR